MIKSNSKVIDLALSELVAMLSMGEAAIVRFCWKMELEGFRELKLLSAIDDDGKQQETDKHECIGNNLIQTIRIMDFMIRQEETDHAIQLIEEAEYIYFFGIDTSGFTAFMDESRPFRLGKQTKVTTDSRRQLIQTNLCNEKNLIIIVSVSDGTKDLIEVAEVAIGVGCKIITIASHIIPTFAKLSDCVTINYGEVNLMSARTFSPMVSQPFVLDIFTSGYGLHNAGSARITRESIARVIYGKTRDESQR